MEIQVSTKSLDYSKHYDNYLYTNMPVMYTQYINAMSFGSYRNLHLYLKSLLALILIDPDIKILSLLIKMSKYHTVRKLLSQYLIMINH